MSGPTIHEGQLDASDLTIGLVVARFNEAITERLEAGAVDALRRHGADVGSIRIVRVPGCFEIPVALEALADSVDALVALGCVVRGATPHFDHVAGPCASGCSDVARTHGTPVGFGVLTVDTWEQAVERAGGKLGNKGAEAVLAAVETAQVLRSL
ncbi:MAG: 6,7-dimethyl-8-ribityllumazine synthase [Nitriliruptoraceae bacterium]